jgi:hypothetical protein
MASILMVLCQICLVYFWVKLKNKAMQQRELNTSRSSNETEADIIDTTVGGESSKKETVAEKFEPAFWYWNKFSNYMLCIASMIGILAALTWAGQNNKVFIDTMGMMSSGIEVSEKN